MMTFDTDLSTLDGIAARAASAAAALQQTPLTIRSAALVAAAGTLTAHQDELARIAADETGLGFDRLAGEVRQCSVQLRIHAAALARGEFLDARIDLADPDYGLGPRPDLRRCLVPLGPVLNFAASNFPFAFSVAGVDTVSALAAGCPVIVKAHPGHPETSARTFALVSGAITEAGLPTDSLQIIFGQEAGIAMLRHDRVRAASFTGSVRAGTHLARIAAERPRPIPFFGELGSVNPVVVTAAAARERGDEIARGFVEAFSWSVGQVCTKPGMLFVPRGFGRDAEFAQAAAANEERRLLHPGVALAFSERHSQVSEATGVRVVAAGAMRTDERDHGWVTPAVVVTDVETLLTERDALADEAFGPLGIVVEYDGLDQVDAALAGLFTGNLTSTIMRSASDDAESLRRLTLTMQAQAGRVVFDAWPMDVHITWAQQHGGPWPASTNDSSVSTSVGPLAVRRFMRAAAWQDAPEALLPEPLKTSNPWRVAQRISRAGESASRPA